MTLFTIVEFTSSMKSQIFLYRKTLQFLDIKKVKVFEMLLAKDKHIPELKYLNIEMDLE